MANTGRVSHPILHFSKKIGPDATKEMLHLRMQPKIEATEQMCEEMDIPSLIQSKHGKQFAMV
jgi:hypothetical protein